MRQEPGPQVYLLQGSTRQLKHNPEKWSVQGKHLLASSERCYATYRAARARASPPVVDGLTLPCLPTDGQLRLVPVSWNSKVLFR